MGALAAQAADVFVPGLVKEEFWSGLTKDNVEGGAAVAPDFTHYLPTFEIPINVANNYAARVSGLFVAPATADYIFDISADDFADFFISTDATPANLRLVAQQVGWNAARQWTSDAGGATPTQRESNTWSPDPAGANNMPYAAGIHLIAGNKYYFEGVMSEFGGGDNFAARYRTLAEPIADDGVGSNFSNLVVGVNVPLPTGLTIDTQPANVSTPAGSAANFSVGVTTDSVLGPFFQWRKNNTPIVGATGSSLSYLPGTADNNAKFDVVVSVPGFTNTSTQATLTVTPANIVAGKLKQEVFSGKSIPQVESGAAGAPSAVSAWDILDAPVDIADNYTRRVSGYFTPATAGAYVFFVTADDNADFFISTDDSPANKRLVAQELGWANHLNWTTDPSNAGPIEQKRSDSWSPDGGTTHPYSAGITLAAGTKYYIEAVHNEGGGGDNLSATFKLLAEADPADGTDNSKFTGSVISTPLRSNTTLTIATQPANATVAEGSTTNLSVVTSTDGDLTPTFQWRKNGNIITNATSATLPVYGVATDVNAKYSVVATIPGTALTVTSTDATVTVTPGVVSKGFLNYEFFPGGNRAAVENGTAGSPNPPGPNVNGTDSGIVTIWDSQVNFADSYVNKYSGLFLPPTSGAYVFFVAADDDSDLFLSTDDSPANKRLIAQEAGWSNHWNWNTSGGGTVSQKRSDQWSPDAGTTVPFASGIQLNAGTRYYIEGAHTEGGGGDNFSVTFKLISEADPADGDATRMTGDVIAVLAPTRTITIGTQPPATANVVDGRPLTLTAAATAAPDYPVSYQWTKNGTNIPNATRSSYTTPNLTLAADQGVKYAVVVSVPGGTPTTSQVTTVTIVPDTTPPTLTGAGSLNKLGGGVEIGLGFDEALDPVTAADPSKYALSAGTLGTPRHVKYASGPTVGAVVLPVTGVTPGQKVTVTVTGVKDVAGNAMAATPKEVTIGTLNWTQVGGNDFVDVGCAGCVPPTTPESVDKWGPDAVAVNDSKDFDLVSGGASDWVNYEELTFVYEEVTGDFDKIVRVEYQDPTSQWARVGLMARAALNENVKHADAYEATANPTGIPFAPNVQARVNPASICDPAGIGNNAYEFIYRTNPGGNYNGVGAGVPQYPNAWIRLTRTGQGLSGYRSTDGVNWVVYGSVNFLLPHITEPGKDGVVQTNLPAKMFVGMFYGPEFLNNTAHDCFGHSGQARFHDYGDFGTVVTPPTDTNAVHITSATLAGGQITINWTGGGTLQTGANLNSATTGWADVPGANNGTFTGPAGTGTAFYRVRK